VADEQRGWRQFQKLNFDSKKMSKRMKKAEGATTRHAHKFILTRLDNIRSARRQIIGWLVLVGCMVAAVGLQLMWFQQSYMVKAADDGGTYAEASLGPIDTLNPLYAASSAEVAASHLMFSSLYSYDSSGQLQGDLAEDLRVDDSGKVYTVKLRPNAVWHDGTHLTAKDVAFTVNLIKNPETRSPLRVNWQEVDAAALNDTTVVFTLPATYAAFPHALTFSVLPEHILKSVPAGAIRENTFSRAPVGSGPFSFKLLQTANTASGHKVVHMTAFENYYKGAPKLSRFEVHAYNTQDSIVKALRTGEVSAASDVSTTDVSHVDTHNYRIESHPVNSGVYTLFNLYNPILKDPVVRQALQQATDTKAIRSSLSDDVPALDLPFVNGQLTGTDIPHAAPANAKHAAELLDSAGWKLVGSTRQKDGQKLELKITTTKNDEYEKVLEVLASQWRQLGITVHADVIDTSDPSVNFVQDILQRRNYDILLYELLIGADPDVYAYWHSSQIAVQGYNFANYSNPIADTALASARSSLSPELRNAKYKTFAKEWLKDAPAIGLYQPVAQYVSNKHVSSVGSSAKLVSASDRYSDILYWSVKEKSVYKTP
jgi:peptide/nickel transport system substrate-binding protein